MLANCTLPVFVKGEWKPKRAAVGQRAKAGIKVIKPRINEFDRDSETTEHLRDGAVRLNVRAKFVTAKEHIAAEERVTFALEIEFFRQPAHLVPVLFHPFGKKWLLTGAFFMAEIAGDKLAADGQASIGGENHIGKSRLRRN